MRDADALPETLAGWPLRIERPRGARRMRLSVGEGTVLLRWPESIAASQVRQFLDAHHGWIEEMVAKHRNAESRAAQDLCLQPFSAGHLIVLGQRLPVHWEDGPGAIEIGTDRVRLRVPMSRAQPSRVAQRLAIGALSRRLQDCCRHWLQTHEPAMGVRARALRLRPMRSLWGSLSPQGVVSLNSGLAFCPEAQGEYVLVHELAHFHARHHGPRFWAVVARHYPAYMRQRSALNRDHLYVQALLRRLHARLPSPDVP